MKLGGRLGKYLSGDQGGLRVARGLVLLLGTLAYFGARCNVIVGSFAEGALQGFHRVGVEEPTTSLMPRMRTRSAGRAFKALQGKLELCGPERVAGVQVSAVEAAREPAGALL